MECQPRPLQIVPGATFTQRYVWSRGPEGAPVPVDMTGCTAKMQVRAEFGSDDVLAELTTENGGITLGDDGSVELRIEADDTDAFTFESGVFDIFITFPTSPEPTVERPITGSVVVLPRVTE